MPGKKILVADDSLTIQKVIRLALSNEGYEIQAVSDGNDAIQQISLFRPNIVLIDVSLPGQTAFEVKREINQQGDLEEVRFVLMSSAFEKVDESQAEEVVFHGRLTKPFDPAHLRQVLSDVLAQITAKRKEKTSLLQRPQPPAPTFSPPAIPSYEDEPENDSPPDFELPPPLHQEASTYPSFHSPRDLLIPEEMMEDDPIDLPPPPLQISTFESVHSDLPTFPPPLSEELSTLWEPGEDPTNSSIIVPFPDALKTHPPMEDKPLGNDDNDIKELTASTMRINGTEDFEWSVNEPSLSPLPNMLDRGGSNFEIQPPLLPKKAQQEALFPPLPPSPQSPASSQTLFSSTVITGELNQPKPLLNDQINDMVRTEVQAMLEKMAQKLLPDIVEKIIKQEIHRLLSE